MLLSFMPSPAAVVLGQWEQRQSQARTAWAKGQGVVLGSELSQASERGRAARRHAAALLA